MARAPSATVPSFAALLILVVLAVTTSVVASRNGVTWSMKGVGSPTFVTSWSPRSGGSEDGSQTPQTVAVVGSRPDSRVSAIDPASGEIFWSKDLGRKEPLHQVILSVSGEAVAVASGTAISVYASGDGAFEWKAVLPEWMGGERDYRTVKGNVAREWAAGGVNGLSEIVIGWLSPSCVAACGPKGCVGVCDPRKSSTSATKGFSLKFNDPAFSEHIHSELVPIGIRVQESFFTVLMGGSDHGDISSLCVSNKGVLCGPASRAWLAITNATLSDSYAHTRLTAVSQAPSSRVHMELPLTWWDVESRQEGDEGGVPLDDIELPDALVGAQPAFSSLLKARMAVADTGASNSLVFFLTHLPSSVENEALSSSFDPTMDPAEIITFTPEEAEEASQVPSGATLTAVMVWRGAQGRQRFRSLRFPLPEESHGIPTVSDIGDRISIPGDGGLWIMELTTMEPPKWKFCSFSEAGSVAHGDGSEVSVEARGGRSLLPPPSSLATSLLVGQAPIAIAIETTGAILGTTVAPHSYPLWWKESSGISGVRGVEAIYHVAAPSLSPKSLLSKAASTSSRYSSSLEIPTVATPGDFDASVDDSEGSGGTQNGGKSLKWPTVLPVGVEMAKRVGLGGSSDDFLVASSATGGVWRLKVGGPSASSNTGEVALERPMSISGIVNEMGDTVSPLVRDLVSECVPSAAFTQRIPRDSSRFLLVSSFDPVHSSCAAEKIKAMVADNGLNGGFIPTEKRGKEDGGLPVAGLPWVDEKMSRWAEVEKDGLSLLAVVSMDSLYVAPLEVQGADPSAPVVSPVALFRGSAFTMSPQISGDAFSVAVRAGGSARSKKAKCTTWCYAEALTLSMPSNPTRSRAMNPVVKTEILQVVPEPICGVEMKENPRVKGGPTRPQLCGGCAGAYTSSDDQWCVDAAPEAVNSSDVVSVGYARRVGENSSAAFVPRRQEQPHFFYPNPAGVALVVSSANATHISLVDGTSGHVSARFSVPGVQANAGEVKFARSVMTMPAVRISDSAPALLSVRVLLPDQEGLQTVKMFSSDLRGASSPESGEFTETVNFKGLGVRVEVGFSLVEEPTAGGLSVAAAGAGIAPLLVTYPGAITNSILGAPESTLFPRNSTLRTSFEGGSVEQWMESDLLAVNDGGKIFLPTFISHVASHSHLPSPLRMLLTTSSPRESRGHVLAVGADLHYFQVELTHKAPLDHLPNSFNWISVSGVVVGLWVAVVFSAIYALKRRLAFQWA